MLPKESPRRLLDSKVGTWPTEPHTPSVQAIGDDSNCGSETEDESLLETTTDFPKHRMTPQFARQKAAGLSYEIGALVKIKERLERQRERLITKYYTDWSESPSDAQVFFSPCLITFWGLQFPTCQSIIASDEKAQPAVYLTLGNIPKSERRQVHAVGANDEWEVNGLFKIFTVNVINWAMYPEVWF